MRVTKKLLENKAAELNKANNTTGLILALEKDSDGDIRRLTIKDATGFIVLEHRYGASENQMILFHLENIERRGFNSFSLTQEQKDKEAQEKIHDAYLY